MYSYHFILPLSQFVCVLRVAKSTNLKNPKYPISVNILFEIKISRGKSSKIHDHFSDSILRTGFILGEDF